MVKKKRLSRSILDSGLYEFRRQLSYKAELRNNKIFIADRWFASSKKCSSCGHQKETFPYQKEYINVINVSLKIDRDLNAAICLVELINTVSSTEIDACGQDGSVIMLKTLLQPAWLKQELSPV